MSAVLGQGVELDHRVLEEEPVVDEVATAARFNHAAFLPERDGRGRTRPAVVTIERHILPADRRAAGRIEPQGIPAAGIGGIKIGDDAQLAVGPHVDPGRRRAEHDVASADRRVHSVELEERRKRTAAPPAPACPYPQ